MIPDEIVREVRERAAILEVVSDYVGLKKAGTNYLGLCPFHAEKTPSFTVNPVKGMFHCFGCGVGGDVVSFVMRMEGLPFPEALRVLARRVGVEIVERPLTAREKRFADERETLYQLYEIATRFYEKVLLEDAAGERVRAYLRRRGVDGETTRAYRLGFAPDTWDSLAHYLEQQKVPLEAAEKAGLLRQREQGGYYDGFRNRLLFPISDIQGRPIGFGGRVLDDALPKYLNSPESPVYRKSDVLFGLGMAKHAIREKGAAFIVEGYFDHLALFRAGIRNVVATCGTALTVGHLKTIRRFADKAYLLFDGDSAGKKATVRSMDIFLEEQIPALVVQMPAGEDPDTYLEKYGVDSFSKIVADAQPIIEFFFKDLCRQTDISGVGGKIAVLDELAPRLRKIVDSVERDLYVREIARFLAVEEKDVRRKLGKGASGSTMPLSGRRERQRTGSGPEDMLLCLMGRYPEIVRMLVDFGPDRIFRRELLPVAERIIDCVAAENPIDWSYILDAVDSREERSRLASLFVEEGHLEGLDVRKAFEQCRRALDRVALREIKELTVELARTEPESDAYRELLHRIDALRARKSQLT
jgi:DNA primase